MVIPGFIDQHIHGANGADHMDASQDALKTSQTFCKRGTTASYNYNDPIKRRSQKLWLKLLNMENKIIQVRQRC